MSPEFGGRRGPLLIGAVSVAILWLAVSGRLDLYVSPRHEVFVCVMAAVGLVLSAVRLPTPRGHDHAAESVSGRLRAAGRAATGSAAAAAAALLVLPPTTLSSATAVQRSINSTAAGQPAPGSSAAAPDTTVDSASFGLDDWAAVLRQTTDLEFYRGREVNAFGFVTPDPEDPENMFYVSRFVITHCALDAQPIGVPVYLEGWQDTLEPDEWVQVDGEFGSNRSSASALGIALLPDGVEAAEEPDEPYLY